MHAFIVLETRGKVWLRLDRANDCIRECCLISAQWCTTIPLSLPSNHRKRDRAREEMYRIFNEILQKRRETPSESDEDDMLNTLLQASYK